MKSRKVPFKSKFTILLHDKFSQAAEMVLQPGASESGPENKHKGSDQWLFVVEGTGEARINGRKKKLKKHSLILIERGDTHEIQNRGKSVMKTLNFYVPPAYTKTGEETPRGSR